MMRWARAWVRRMGAGIRVLCVHMGRACVCGWQGFAAVNQEDLHVCMRSKHDKTFPVRRLQAGAFRPLGGAWI